MEDKEDLEASAQEDELESNPTPVPPEESNEETEAREHKRKKKAKKKKIKSKKVIVGDNVEIDEEDIIQHAIPEQEKKVIPSKKQDFFVQSNLFVLMLTL
jgi:putative ribosome biogenesis GTPase RsgA